MNEKIVVCGAGGYIGGRLVKFLVEKGYYNIRAVSFRPVSEWLYMSRVPENVQLDLRHRNSCEIALEGAQIVYNLAARVGGIGYIETHKTEGMLSSLINTHLLLAASKIKLIRYFFASSSCVYHSGNPGPIFKEADAYPANPQDGYGWEKLFSERMCANFAEEYQIPVSVARFHGIYGPGDIRPVGRDHAIAALCLKVIEAKLSGRNEINIWGDGSQTRSFLYIDDCIEGVYRLVNDGVSGPVNLANSEIVSVDGIVNMLEEISGTKLIRFYNKTAPCGQQHKCSDNTLLRKSLAWEPMTPIRIGLERTYRDFWDRAVFKK